MKRIIASTFGSLLLTLALAGPVVGQNLPPAPQASSDSMASRRGTNGGALEPYLITWLLPIFGLIGLGACVVVDRRLRSLHH